MDLFWREGGDRPKKVLGIIFAGLVIMALASICGDIIMRVRLTTRETPRERLGWWRRGGDEVAGAYQELFPGSPIPKFRRFFFWLLIGVCSVVLVAILLNSR